MELEDNQTQKYESQFTDYLSRNFISGSRQYTLDLDQLRRHSPEVAFDVIKNPAKYYKPIKKQIQEGLKHGQDNREITEKLQHFDIKFQGNLGANFVSPRGLSSRMGNQLVGIQGIITKIDVSKHYLQKSVQYCPQNKSYVYREYPDAFNPEKNVQLNQTKYIPTQDAQKRKLQFQFGLSTFKDLQMAVIQELPQMAPPGLLPMSVPVVLQGKLHDSVKPGDRVEMIGIYKLIAGLAAKQKGIFKAYFICLSVKPLTKTQTLLRMPQKADFPEEQIYPLFSRSIAPAIWGHDYLKKAVLLMLVGGVEKNLDNGTHLRGDINILMVGDPGTAKSQMLRWVLSTVDVAIGTTGSGASGVGLTAAIVTDSQTGQKNLEAGAMVLADRGVVCIDQFDKMNEVDRVAVHEVMQQQTVTIAKAGLTCSLNARCSVIAAANPIYGQYQDDKPPTRNVGMPDSLLSRFDLIFIIRDEKNNSTRDLSIAAKVCKNHRLAPQSNEFLNQFVDESQYVVNPIQHKKNQPMKIYEKNNVYKDEAKGQLLTQAYLKSYINFVKTAIQPVLTDQAITLSSQLWSILREKDRQEKSTRTVKVLPITIRTYESLIRLSTAHAKLRRSQHIQIKDVIEGFRLLVFSLYGNQFDLDEDLFQAIKQLGLQSYVTLEFKNMKKNKYPVKQNQPKDEDRKIKTEDSLTHKISKLDIGKDIKEADEHLKRQVEGSKKKQKQFSADQQVLVFKKISELLARKPFGKKQLQKIQLYQLFSKILTPQKIDSILDDLEAKEKLYLEEGKIYM